MAIATKNKTLKRHGNRKQCLEGCGRWVLIGKPICRKCKRRNKLRIAKMELRERKSEKGAKMSGHGKSKTGKKKKGKKKKKIAKVVQHES